MRIFVGTMYTIENEFKECVKAIQNQTYKNYKHFVFKNLPNKEAHEKLYGTFMEKSNEFDLLIKVDADMVIQDKKLFEKIIKIFREDPNLDELNIAVFDNLSDMLIFGMHTYRNTVIWPIDDENLFVDKTPNSVKKQIFDKKELAPAAIHNKNATFYQAFHFGFHRGLKAIQPGRVRAERATFQWKIIKGFEKKVKFSKDIRALYALLGAELALTGKFPVEYINYNNKEFKNLYNKFNEMKLVDISDKVKHLKKIRIGSIPYPFDYINIFLTNRIKAWMKNEVVS